MCMCGVSSVVCVCVCVCGVSSVVCVCVCGVSSVRYWHHVHADIHTYSV